MYRRGNSPGPDPWRRKSEIHYLPVLCIRGGGCLDSSPRWEAAGLWERQDGRGGVGRLDCASALGEGLQQRPGRGLELPLELPGILISEDGVSSWSSSGPARGQGSPKVSVSLRFGSCRAAL